MAVTSSDQNGTHRHEAAGKPAHHRPLPRRLPRPRPRLTPRAAAWGAPFALVLTVLLARNASLFSRSYYEDADMGANSILIEQARHFRLLVGDYSRLGFNHPGPAYLYVQAWGESVFYDLLHVVPTPWNGQVLAVYLLNSALVGLVVAVVYGWTGSVAAAGAGLAGFAGFAAVHPMILSSDWMSYLYVVTYTLFVVAAASVAAGGGRRDAPVAVLAGWLLLHGHAAFLFFVPVLTVAALGCALWPARRAWLRSPGRAARRAFAGHRAVWAAVAVISAVFALPVLVNLALHWPGDFAKYFSYGSSAKSGRHPAGAVVRYVLWFWWPGANPPALPVLAAVPVLGYAAAAALAWRGATGPVRRFLLALLGLNLLSSAAFTAYAATGVDDLTRNGHYIGYFYWSAPLITVLVIGLGGIGLLSTGRDRAAVIVAVVAAAAACAALAVAPQTRLDLNHVDPANPATGPATDPTMASGVAAIARLAAGRPAVLAFAHDAWPAVTGVLVQAERTGVTACVASPGWRFMMTSQFICTPAELARGRVFHLYVPGQVPRGVTLEYRLRRGVVTAGGKGT